MRTKQRPVNELSLNLKAVRVTSTAMSTNISRNPNLACGTITSSPASYFSCRMRETMENIFMQKKNCRKIACMGALGKDLFLNAKFLQINKYKSAYYESDLPVARHPAEGMVCPCQLCF